MGEHRGRIWIAGGLFVMVLAGVILFLFVMPAINGSGDSVAQAQPPGGGMGGPPGGGMGGAMGGPPGGGMGGAMGGPPGGGMGGAMGGPPGGGMGGAMGGPPGGGMGGAMGGPPGGGMGGAMGGGMDSMTPVAAPLVAAVDNRKLEGSRPNPFLPRGAVAGEDGTGIPPFRTSYGANWATLPITYRLGFVRPHVPAAREVRPPAAVELPAADMIITSILWTQDGQAIAGYEIGPTGRKRNGSVKPGDIVDDWQVLEIWRDRVVIADKENGRQRTIYLNTRKSSTTPTTTAPAPTGNTSGTRGGRRPAAPTVNP